MVKRPKLENAGEINDEVDPAAEVDASFTQEGNEDSAQDIADQEAAGVPTRPTAHAAHAASNGAGDNKRENISPKQQLNALKRTVTAIGAQHGAGKTSMIQLAEVVTEAAMDILTPDLVADIYDKFREGVVAKSSYEDAGVVPDEAAMDRIGNVDQDKSREQQLSKLRQFIHLGNKYDTDALDLIRKARNMHIELLRHALGSAEAKKGVKPGSTYSILVDVARAQLKKQKDAVEAGKRAGVKHTGLAPVLTDDELSALMTQPVNETVDKTGEDYLLDTLVKAKATRKGSRNRNAITCDELDNAIEWLSAALGKVAPDLLDKHNAEEAQAETDAAQAEKDKAERERAKAEKAAQPKLSKAERQAALAQQPAA